MTTRTLIRPLSIAIALCLSAQVSAQDSVPAVDESHQDTHTHSTPVKVGTVQIKSTAARRSLDELVHPVAVLTADALDHRKAQTLGETVQWVSGVHSSGFGPAVGRPVIRGLEGSRVQMLSNGLEAGDVSAISADHAVAMEPFLAEQIEVLKGPASLLYGNGAIGGAVNLNDGRIVEQLPLEPIVGRSERRFGSSSERVSMTRIDATTDFGLVVHGDVLWREVDDLKIPGHALSDAHEDEVNEGVLENSAVKTRAGGLGLSWVGTRAYAGVSGSMFNSRYGIPSGAHEHGDEDHGEHEVEDNHDGDEHDEHGAIRVDMNQRRVDFKAGLLNLGPFASIRPQISRSAYEHTEFEGDAIGTLFENDTRQWRLDALLRPMGKWQHAVGAERVSETLVAVGDEAFIPSSDTLKQALFWYLDGSIGPMLVESAVRAVDHKVSVEQFNTTRDFNLISAAAALRWPVAKNHSVFVGLDHVQRAPGVEELFADGVHVATQSYERGNSQLDTERANRLEASWKFKSPLTELQVTLHHSRFDRFSVLQDTGNEVEGLAERVWIQAPATISGWEMEWSRKLPNWNNANWVLRGLADATYAQLDNDANLPRIAPPRVGAELEYRKGHWQASLSAMHSTKQTRLAANEVTSPAYTKVDAHLSWHHDLANGTGLELFVEGKNLLNEEIRDATSLLKQIAPQAGRSWAVGLRTYF